VATHTSFADNTIDRRSSHTYTVKLFGGIVGWRSSKQTIVTTSTTEAELLAVAQGARKGYFILRLLKELGVQLDEQIVHLEYDNKQTIRLITQELVTLNTRLRHVDIHNHWLRQEHLNNNLRIDYVPTNEQLVDRLTKALQNTAFQAFVDQIRLCDVEEQLKGHELPELDSTLAEYDT